MAEQQTRAILLDVEGTTTPVEFVYEVLFPFARVSVAEFLRRRGDSDDVRADIAALKAERDADIEAGRTPPDWLEDSAESARESAASYARWLMDEDRKSTALKSLQGKVWEEGYARGELRGVVYEDVRPAFVRWRAQGRGVYIFSSGSVLAQRLLFAHTAEDDLTEYIGGNFDTTTGQKSSADSYRAIAASIGALPDEVLFISDSTAELDAAREAGMLTALCVRPGSDEPETQTHARVETFDALFPG
jgi:enolase-phosphatase E1